MDTKQEQTYIMNIPLNRYFLPIYLNVMNILVAMIYLDDETKKMYIIFAALLFFDILIYISVAYYDFFIRDRIVNMHED